MTLAGERARAARAEIAQGFQHVVDDQQRRVGGKLRALVARDHGEAGAGLERGVDEVMAVAVVALDGKEGIARASGCGCRWRRLAHRAGSAPDFSARMAAGHVVDGPERAHATFSFKAAATASWSENCKILSPTIWPVSWPLPAISSTSPAFNSAMAVRIASRAVADLDGARRCGQDRGADRGRLLAARIVVGDDDAVGILVRDAAHDRPFARVAVAAGAEHHDQLAARIRAQRFERFLQRIRLVRIVDKDRRAVFGAGKLQPPLGAG